MGNQHIYQFFYPDSHYSEFDLWTLVLCLCLFKEHISLYSLNMTEHKSSFFSLITKKCFPPLFPLKVAQLANVSTYFHFSRKDFDKTQWFPQKAVHANLFNTYTNIHLNKSFSLSICICSYNQKEVLRENRRTPPLCPTKISSHHNTDLIAYPDHFVVHSS